MRNGLHVAAVHSEDEPAFRGDDPDEPLTLRRKADRQRGSSSTAFRQNADESNDISAFRLRAERVFRFEPEQVACVTEHDFRIGWELALQSGAKRRLRSAGFAHDEGARGADIDDAVVVQLACEDARTEPPVSADVHAPQKNDERHIAGRPYRAAEASRLPRTRANTASSGCAFKTSSRVIQARRAWPTA